MTPRPADQRGFVLSMVIFALAALSIAGTALFLVVQSEGAMADRGADASSAFHLANAGLARYMGESVGLPGDSTTYRMGDGVVTVSAARVMPATPTEDIYLISAQAEIVDRRRAATVSRASVHQFATLRRQPFQVTAAVVIAGSDVTTRNVTLDGNDQATPLDCPTGGGAAVAGIGMLGEGDTRGSSISGDPDVLIHSYAAMMAAIDLDWSTVTDPSVPFDYEVPAEPWPNFVAAVAPDEYPTIRVDGDLRVRSSHSGRGLLVVTGQIDFDDGFTWDGAILAGGINRNATGAAVVNGTLLTGFAGDTDRSALRNARIAYHSCHVLRAAEGLALFSPIPNTWWEGSS